jgi:glyoxylase-like metal-dependent hydrolase (beta-lactamase superfamily II)
MSAKTVSRLAAVAASLVVGWVAWTQNAAPPKLTTNKLTDDLYEIEGDGGNVAVYITSEGLILIDDKYERDHDNIAAEIRNISSLPVKYILSTHYHEDHSGGNAKMFAQGAEIISTKNARTNIVNKVQSNATIYPTPARIVFNDETAVFLGGKEVRAKYYGRGHTNGDAVIYFPALRTVHTGDLMSGNTPLIDYPGGGSVVEWTKTLDGVLNGLDFDRVIPGHGPVTNKAGLLNYRNNVEKLRNRAQSLIREGKSRDDVAKVMTAEFNWQPNGLQMQWSMPGIMSELK